MESIADLMIDFFLNQSDMLISAYGMFLKFVFHSQLTLSILQSFSFSFLFRFRNPEIIGEYCSNHNTALNTIKSYQTGDQRFSEWYKYKESNPLLKRKGLNGFTLSVSHRLTKYPILIDAQIKKCGNDEHEKEKLEQAKKLIKNILEVVNACVAERNKEDRRLDIFKRIDAKSTIMFKNTKFRKSDIMDENRKLK